MGYNVVGSDIKINAAKKNLQWWWETDHAQKQNFLLFKHDVKDEFTKSFLKHVDVIVSE